MWSNDRRRGRRADLPVNKLIVSIAFHHSFLKETMNSRHISKFIHEGQYAAEVDVDVIETDTGWSPYLSIEDAYKLDDVRNALRRGDIKSASRLARVFTLTPVS